jgi:hypothetical protein
MLPWHTFFQPPYLHILPSDTLVNNDSGINMRMSTLKKKKRMLPLNKRSFLPMEVVAQNWVSYGSINQKLCQGRVV